MRRAVLLLAALLLAACDDPAAPAAPRVARWPCPDGWVPGPRGGCGPASLLCDPQRGACTGGRAWREPGDPGGPPSTRWRPEVGRGVQTESWAPEAGMGQCPGGWRRAEREKTCDPAPRADCPAGSVALPGGACVSVAGATCDDDAFPDADPSVTGAVARVRAGADAASADGSAERPFATVNAAIARVGDDGQVLVARGEYRESLEVTGRATVLGRCGVTLVGQPGRPVALVRNAGASLALRRVTLTGGASGAVASDGAALVLNGVRVTAVSGIGVDAEGAGTEVTVDGLVVAGTVTRGSDGGGDADGEALVSRSGARMLARRVVVEGAQGAGVYVEGATATVFDSVVRGTEPRPDGTGGQGLYAAAGGSLTAARVVVEGSYAAGAQADGARAHLELLDVVVRGTRHDAEGRRGSGVVANAGARVEATRVLVADSWGSGALAAGAGSALSLDASVVRGTRSNRDSTGYGLLARDGASVTASATVVERSEGVGAYARAGATLTLAASIVRTTAPGTVVLSDGSTMLQGRYAVGVAAVGATAELDHALLDGAATMAVLARASPGPARVVVRDSSVRTDREDGVGPALAANVGGAIEATRVRMENCGTACADAAGAGASITLDDCVVRRTRRPAAEAVHGALQSLEGASLTARHVAVEDSDRSAAVVGGKGSRLTLEDSSLLRSGLAFEAVTEDHSPHGAVVAFEGATLEATRVVVDGAAGAAVEAVHAGTRVSLDGVIIRAGAAAFGARIWEGARMDARRTVFDANGRFGALATDDGTAVALEDSVVQDTLPALDDRVGVGEKTPRSAASSAGGLAVSAGATLTATRTLLDRNHVAGLVSRGGAVRLDDVTVSATRSVKGLFGVGVLVAGRGTLDARRLALVDVYGAALAASPDDADAEGRPRVTLGDVFIRGVRSSHLSLDPARPRAVMAGAYGLVSGPGSSLAAERVVIDDGEVGFYVAQGTLSLRYALVARQLGAAGAVTRATPAGAVTTTEMFFAGNLSDGVRVRDAAPDIDALPLPSPPCRREGCNVRDQM